MISHFCDMMVWNLLISINLLPRWNGTLVYCYLFVCPLLHLEIFFAPIFLGPENLWVPSKRLRNESRNVPFFTQIPTSTPSPSHRIRSVKAVVEPFCQRSFRGVGFCQNFGGQTKIFVTLKEMGFCQSICKISAGHKRVVINAIIIIVMITIIMVITIMIRIMIIIIINTKETSSTRATKANSGNSSQKAETKELAKKKIKSKKTNPKQTQIEKSKENQKSKQIQTCKRQVKSWIFLVFFLIFRKKTRIWWCFVCFFCFVFSPFGCVFYFSIEAVFDLIFWFDFWFDVIFCEIFLTFNFSSNTGRYPA